MTRPQSIADVASRLAADLAAGARVQARLPYHVNDFNHELRGVNRHALPALDKVAPTIIDEPQLTGHPIVDVFLAGLAEFMANKYGAPVPGWVHGVSRFLETPVVMAKSAEAKQLMIETTAEEWGHRNLFCSVVEF